MRLPGQNLYDGGKLSRMLAQMPDTNNGSHLGGLGSVLMKALMGYQMGKEESDQAEASKAMLEGMRGTPATDGSENADMTPQPAKPGGYEGAMNALSGLGNNPHAGRLAQDLLTRKMERDYEMDQFAQRFNLQNAAQDARFDKQLAASREDRAADREYRDATRKDEQQFRRNMLGLQASMRPPRQVQTVQTAEGVFTINPDGSLGNRLGGSPRANAQQVIGEDENGNPIYGAQAKPMPPAALKLQQEELDAIGAASSIKADMGAAKGMLAPRGEGEAAKPPALQLGPWQNLISRGQNFAGMSDEGSRNYASFVATLEKARNDSLRLNKGVQTEGDAVRAWNELLSNINDPKVVEQRLGEIEQINARAVNMRKLNVDNIRKNYGLGPLDTAGYENVPAAIGKGGLTQDEEAELQALRARFGR